MLDNQIEYDDPLSLHAVVWWIETWDTFSMPLSLLGMGGRNYVALLRKSDNPTSMQSMQSPSYIGDP